jgi:hypothetical protein
LGRSNQFGSDRQLEKSVTSAAVVFDPVSA